MIGATCPTCDRIHAYGDVVAVGRFTPGGPTGYRAAAGGPVRATRLEAQGDVCATWGTARTTYAHHGTQPALDLTDTHREDVDQLTVWDCAGEATA